MARVGGGQVFKSASTGVLRPMGVRGLDKHAAEELDPLQAVLNHSWNRQQKEEEDHGGRKRGAVGQKQSGLKGTDKKDDGRSRLGQTGNSLFVDTTTSKNAGRLAATFEDDAGAAGDSPPVSPGDTAKAPGRRAAKAAAAPARRCHNEVCPDEKLSPRLRTPPMIRNGTVKLDFEKEAAAADAEHGQAELEDRSMSKQHLDPEQEHFIDLVHHFHGAVNQMAVRMTTMLDKVRNHFLEDEAWLENKMNYDQLTEVSFELQTANYFIAKWHHQLEPRKKQAPTRPTKIEDMSAEDILAQALYSISRMEVLASALGPVLEKICHDARDMRRGPNGEPLTPNSKNALSLAKKRGFQDIEEFNKLLGHLEHILAITQHLAMPPKSGLPNRSAMVMQAMNKFKLGLSKPKEATPEGEKTAGAAIGGAFKALGESIDAKVAQEQAES